MHPVEAYLAGLAKIRNSGGGTREESFYGVLETLLNEAGKTLKPKIFCVGQLANLGHGEPDFGLFTKAQQQRNKGGGIAKLKPERGVIEVKGWDEEVSGIAKSEQLEKYLEGYGLVLVTNFRQFVLIDRDVRNNPRALETFAIETAGRDFSDLLEHPRAGAQALGDALLDFLRRVMLHEAALTNPEDLAWFLASYARTARYQLEERSELPALISLRQALEEALGLKFEGEKGEHFFRATLVQTLFYGIFSAWVLWSRQNPGKSDFDWRESAWHLHVPMITSLFEQIATPSKLKPLGLFEILNLAGAVLNRVEQGAFFQRFEEAYAVQYFYEPFLNHYDPELRKDLGVWYTPPEIVAYQVERVDRVLREELDIADGLADDSVVVLDPCCGTGAYIVETLKRIEKTLDEKGGHALVAQKLKRAAKERIFGFEILPAPFVIAHLQIGLYLRRGGAPLNAEGSERAGVYLTNALTGWDPAMIPPKQFIINMPELADERDAARHVKQDERILVIIGNPPYNAFAGASPEEEGDLVKPYKEGLTAPVASGGWGIKKFNLDDLYIRFFRIAENRIVKTGKGVVSFISNFSYLGDPSFVVMRKRMLSEFDGIWIDCMNGDSRETGKLTPEGRPDPSVFSTERSPVGIRVGTAIGMFVRNAKRKKTPIVRFQHHWGVEKRTNLLKSLGRKSFDRKYSKAKPDKSNRYSFRPVTQTKNYRSWPPVNAMSSMPPTNGLMEKRGGALVDIDQAVLEARMRSYFDSDLPWSEVKNLIGNLANDAARFDARETRRTVLSRENFDSDRIRRYHIRPFDDRWCYYCPVRPLWNEPRPNYWKQCWDGNEFLMLRPAGVASPEGFPMCWTQNLGDNDSLRGHAYYIPLALDVNGNGTIDESQTNGELFGDRTANLSKIARAYLSQLGCACPDEDPATAALIWLHALAIGYSPAYLAENADGIRQDWPRIPLPATREALEASAALGRRVADLLDTETGVKGVTEGGIDQALKPIAVISKSGGGQLPESDLAVTAGWGRTGKGGITMPGRGRLEVRACRDEEKHSAWGDETHDIYLNGVAYWRHVPKPVWDYYIGGYQVIKKWLSYREQGVLGRPLKPDEAEYVTEMARRIAALVLLQPELDANYQRVRDDAWPWPQPPA